VFMFRSCDGPEPGRRSGSPCLDYYIKRCEAPCVGYVDKEGKLNHGALLSLLSLSFEGEEQDDEWDRGMQAIRDSIRVIGSKRYVTLHRRESVNAGWTQISIDIASA